MNPCQKLTLVRIITGKRIEIDLRIGKKKDIPGEGDLIAVTSPHGGVGEAEVEAAAAVILKATAMKKQANAILKLTLVG